MDEPLLLLDRVSFKPGDTYILKEITFQLNKGEKTVLTGPSGSGKSTLLQLMAYLLTPTEGRIRYKGQPVEEIESTSYRKKVSYVSQNAQLFDQTVRDNLVFPYHIREESFSEEKAKESLEKVCLPDSYIDKSIEELSGGEKQRIALIRHLLFDPDILLLDEVTSSLDSANQAIVFDLLDTVNEEKQCTLLISTHDQKQIDESDRLIRLTNGRLEGNK